ncbi:hypothetical protein [Ensifer sp. LCM 4579]|uniref:hypothetical protein n=1 Tax=Ensifer sp. LCM 4579 TaxID=1848292 RepID=UPI000E2EE7FA|nr:hypothetical protein [Ensifer sp. LCM 4579]
MASLQPADMHGFPDDYLIAFFRFAAGSDRRTVGARLQNLLLRVSFIALDLRTKTCSNSKCYGDLCASKMTRGAVAFDFRSGGKSKLFNHKSLALRFCFPSGIQSSRMGATAHVAPSGHKRHHEDALSGNEQ